MAQFLGGLAEPWTRRWTGQVAGAALAFWIAGLLAYLLRVPASAFSCPPARLRADLWRRAHEVGMFGLVVAAVTAALRPRPRTLARVDADAIVYLLGPPDGGTARAIVVAAEGLAATPPDIPLPSLRTGAGSPLDAYVTAYQALLACPAAPPGTEGPPAPGQRVSARNLAIARWRRALGDLCERATGGGRRTWRDVGPPAGLNVAVARW